MVTTVGYYNEIIFFKFLDNTNVTLWIELLNYTNDYFFDYSAFVKKFKEQIIYYKLEYKIN